MTDLSFTTDPSVDLGLPSSPGSSGSVTINPESSVTIAISGKDGTATKRATKEIRVLRSGESDFKLFSFGWGGYQGENAGT